MKIKQKHPVLNLMTEIQRDAVGFSVIAQGKVPVVKSIENFQYGGQLFDFTIFPAHELLPFFRKIRRTASPPRKIFEGTPLRNRPVSMRTPPPPDKRGTGLQQTIQQREADRRRLPLPLNSTYFAALAKSEIV